MSNVRRWSLKRRLAIRLFAVLAFGMLGPSAFVIAAALWAINSMDDRALQDQAADIVRNLDVAASPPVLKLPDSLASAYRTSGDSYLYAVLAPDGKAVAASSPTAAAALGKAISEGEQHFFIVPRIEAESVWYAYAVPAGPYVVAVAQGDLHQDALSDSVIRDLVNFSFATTIPLLLVTLAVAWWTLNRAFREVDQVAASARSIAPGGPDVHLPDASLPEEIRPLVQAVNVAIGRLGKAYEIEKRFTADAAHEMRTPLAVLTARIDTLPDSTMRTALAADIGRLNRLVSQMLSVARLDAAPLMVGAKADLARIVIDAVAVLGPLAIQSGRTLSLNAPPQPVQVRGDAQALALAVTNLVENAMMHTPAGTPIDIDVSEDAVVRVMDRGSGIAPEERATIFERFMRSQEATTPGTGLGLAIVREIALQHGGTASVEDRPGGGSVFVLSLPRWRED